MTTSELRPVLTSLLQERTSPGRPAIINLVGSPAVFRLEALPGLDPRSVTLSALTNHELPWRSVGRVTRLFGQLSEELALAGGGHGWAGTLLPFLTAMAGNWAARLTDEMGCSSTLSALPDTFGSRFQSPYNACLKETRQTQRIVRQIGDSLLQCMRRPPDGCSQSDLAVMLHLESNGGAVEVSWLAPEGRELCREPLDRLVERVCSSSGLLRLLDEAKRVQARQEQHWAAGNEQLEATCPELAEAVEHAVKTHRPVGHWVASTKVRGLPADVYLFIDPVTEGGRTPRVTLLAQRAHEEFILGNARGSLFYFPPIQLVARIDFTAVSPPWCVVRPRVRMPRNGPPWRHPYTGSLSVDPFSKAELLGGSGREAMAPASEQARRLLPSLAQNGFPEHAGVSDLCLRGQDLCVRRLVDRTVRIGPFRRELNLSALVKGLWEIARVGLTSGHQNHTHMPRLSLTSGNMCYPISGRAALKETPLSRRVFPYNAGASW